MKTLEISPDLLLPLDIVTERSAFIGRTGQGKSYAAQKLAELLYAEKAQFIVLDPVGIWWGLRLAANGKDPGLEIPVLGGLHGDVPLEAGAGKLIADLAIDRRLSMVLDVSDFEHDTDRNKFAGDFAARFFHRKKAQPSAVLIFLEEQQEFVPQNPGPKETAMLHAFTRMAKVGRNYGIGVCGITQRPQEVNKKVLNLTELLFAFQLNGTHERKAVEKWIQDKAIDEDIGAELPKLKPWHPHAWSPSWLGISKVVRINRKWTFDAGSTPKAGAAAGTLRPLGPIDLEKLRTTMAATIEKAKAEDPRELRRVIAGLQRELAAKPKPAAPLPAPKAEVVKVEVPVVKPAEMKRLEVLVAKLQAWSEAGREHAKTADALFRQVAGAVNTAFQAQARRDAQPLRPAPPRPVAPPRPAPQPRAPQATASSNGHLGIGERTVLIAIAQQDGGAARDQLSILTGYKRSTRDAYLQRLRVAGLIEGQGDLHVATPEGIAALGDSYEPLPTGDALRTYWLNKLPEGERRLLEPLLDAYPNAVGRDALDEATGYKRSTRDAYLQRLASRRLVETIGRGEVRAREELFG